jgi:predicted MPP superfamily phosphohydrolase
MLGSKLPNLSHNEGLVFCQFLITPNSPVKGAGIWGTHRNLIFPAYRHSGENRNPATPVSSGCRIESGITIRELFTWPSRFGEEYKMRFVIFLLVFLSLYSGLHLYGFLKAKRALILGTGATIVLVVFMAIMVLAPILVRLIERMGYETVARVVAYVGYTWMGLLFLFFTAALVLDLYRLFIFIGQTALKSDLQSLTPSPRNLFFISLLLSVSITVYGSFEALDIRKEQITIKTDKLPATVLHVRIAQISDVHLGLIVGEKRLKRIIDIVTAAKPDILVSTGDLMDGQADNLSGLADLLSKTPAKYGKFAITGNHEFYAGLNRSMAFTERAGFKILRGDGVNIGGILNIAGVDDIAGKPYGLMREISETMIFSKLPQDRFTLFLKHRPVVEKKSTGFFDLQLSGHTHKGQIFPFNLITKLYFPKQAGLETLGDHTYLYVSRGTGTWGPPIRFLSPPEVTIIDLVSK